MKIRKLLEILNLDNENYQSYTDFMVEIVGIYEDLDNEVVYDYTMTELKNKVAVINKILTSSPTAAKKITIENVSFEKIPFEKLTLGAYIDLEHFCVKPTDIAKVISILYRRSTQADKFSEKIYESYDDWLNEREEIFLDLDATQVIGVKSEYLNWRSKVLSNYSGLFDTYQGDEDLETMDESSRIQAENAKKMDEKRKAFAWESTILRLCNQNASDFTKILELPVLLVFNLLSTLKLEQ